MAGGENGDKNCSPIFQHIHSIDGVVSHILYNVDVKQKSDIIEDLQGDIGLDILSDSRDLLFEKAVDKFTRQVETSVGYKPDTMQLSLKQRKGVRTCENMAKDIYELFLYVEEKTDFFPKDILFRTSRYLDIAPNNGDNDARSPKRDTNQVREIANLHRNLAEIANAYRTLKEDLENEKKHRKECIKRLEIQIRDMQSVHKGQPGSAQRTSELIQATIHPARSPANKSSDSVKHDDERPTQTIARLPATADVNANKEITQRRGPNAPSGSAEETNNNTPTEVTDNTTHTEVTDNSILAEVTDNAEAKDSRQHTGGSNTKEENVNKSPTIKQNQEIPETPSSGNETLSENSTESRISALSDSPTQVLYSTILQKEGPWGGPWLIAGSNGRKRKVNLKGVDSNKYNNPTRQTKRTSTTTGNKNRILRGGNREKVLTTQLYIENIEKEEGATDKDIEDLVKEHVGHRPTQLMVMTARVIHNRFNHQICGCRITVPADKADIFLENQLWPEGITCRTWEKEKPRLSNTISRWRPRGDMRHHERQTQQHQHGVNYHQYDTNNRDYNYHEHDTNNRDYNIDDYDYHQHDQERGNDNYYDHEDYAYWNDNARTWEQH